MPYLPAQIDDDEYLTNFVLESNKFKNEKLPGGGIRLVVTYKAFEPGAGERSVFRMDGLSEDAIAELGRAFVGQPREKPIYGWGRLTAGVVRRVVPLQVRADEPPPRHAVIDTWPPDIEHARVLMMELASEASEAGPTKLPQPLGPRGRP
jgi:hypothetical protein